MEKIVILVSKMSLWSLSCKNSCVSVILKYMKFRANSFGKNASVLM